MTRIAIVGDTMIDSFITGTLQPSQDGCPKFVEMEQVTLPGGAANAARAIEHSGAEVFLVGPVPRSRGESSTWHGINSELGFDGELPVKTRFLDHTGRIVFRKDQEPIAYGAGKSEIAEWRDLAVKAVRNMKFDAVYVSDYDKGFVDGFLIRKIIQACDELSIPVVVDPKRHPDACVGAILKCNADYAMRYPGDVGCHAPAAVVTHGHLPPSICDDQVRQAQYQELPRHGNEVVCANHVGAGDCFGAWLTLLLGKGELLERAVKVADAAARVYVAHPFNRPPWWHEVRRKLDPVRGKILNGRDMTGLTALRQSGAGRIVFTNGVWRIPHVGHSWLLRWAKGQGDTLVVGVNDDASAARIRPGEFVLPLEERLEMLASMEAVDWVVPFGEDDPVSLIRQLRPDVLVKGGEYRGTHVPGEEDVDTTLFAPDGPFSGHVSDLVAAVRSGV